VFELFDVRLCRHQLVANLDLASIKRHNLLRCDSKGRSISGVEKVQFSPDDQYILTLDRIGFSHQITIYDTNSMSKLQTIDGHDFMETGMLWAYDISPNCKFLVLTDATSIWLYDISTEKCVGEIDVHCNIRSIKFSSSGKYILAGLSNNTAVGILVEEFRIMMTFSGHSQPINAVDYLDSRYIITASEDKTIRVWDMITGEYVTVLDGHDSCVNNVCVISSLKYLISASDDKTIRIWDLNVNECIKVFHMNTNVKTLSARSDEKGFIAICKDETIWEIHLDTLEGQKILSHDSDHVVTVNYSTDCKKIITGSTNGNIRIYNLDTYVCIGEIASRKPGILQCECDNAGKYVAMISADNTIKIWNFEKNSIECILESDYQHLRYSVFSDDNERIYVKSKCGIEEFNIQEERCIAKSEEQLLLISPELRGGDTNFYLFREKNYAYIYNNATKNECGILPHENILGALYSPDKKNIVTFSWNYLKLWDSSTLRCIKELMVDKCDYVSISPDGKRMIISALEPVNYSSVKAIVYDLGTMERVGEIIDKFSTFSGRGIYSSDMRWIVYYIPMVSRLSLYNAETFEEGFDVIDVPGLFVHGLNLRNLAPGSNFTEEDKRILRMYGALID